MVVKLLKNQLAVVHKGNENMRDQGKVLQVTLLQVKKLVVITIWWALVSVPIIFFNYWLWHVKVIFIIILWNLF